MSYRSVHAVTQPSHLLLPRWLWQEGRLPVIVQWNRSRRRLDLLRYADDLPLNVRYWHLADIPIAPADGRFGVTADIGRLWRRIARPLMTQKTSYGGYYY